jgi:hypothetical protein
MSDNWQISTEEFWTTEIKDDPTAVEELADLADGFEGYKAMDFQWCVQRVADRIFNIHRQRDVANQFVFSLTCNTDGEIDGGVVNLSIPQTGLYLCTSVEWKRMTNDREATGREGLLAIKEALLDYEYLNIVRMASVWGLMHSNDNDNDNDEKDN